MNKFITSKLFLFLILPGLIGLVTLAIWPKHLPTTPFLLSLSQIFGVLGAVLIFAPLGFMQAGIISGTSKAFAIPYLSGCVIGLISTLWMPNYLTIFLEASLMAQTIMNLIFNRKKTSTESTH